MLILKTEQQEYKKDLHQSVPDIQLGGRAAAVKQATAPTTHYSPNHLFYNFPADKKGTFR